MKIFNWVIGGFVYLVMFTFLYLFMIDMVQAVGSLMVSMTKHPTHFIAMGISLTLVYFYKKDAVGKAFAGFKKKVFK